MAMKSECLLVKNEDFCDYSERPGTFVHVPGTSVPGNNWHLTHFFTHCVSLPRESTGPQDSRYRLQFAILTTRIPENWKRTSWCRCTTQRSCLAAMKAMPLSRTQLNFPHCCCNCQVVAGCRSQVVPGCTAAPRRAGRPPGTRPPPGTPRATPPPCRSPAAPGPTRRAAQWTGKWG